MMNHGSSQLEQWLGGFGREYTDRNACSYENFEALYVKNYGVSRTELNQSFLEGLDRNLRILEVGSNVGNQLLCLQKMGFTNLFGIEPQEYALSLSQKRLKGIQLMQGSAFQLPFEDHSFDLVFTSGVLIHIDPKN